MSTMGNPETSEQSESAFKEAARQRAGSAARSAAAFSQDAAHHYVQEPAYDVLGLLRDYARQKPDVAAMWCFGIGIIVGWKLKP